MTVHPVRIKGLPLFEHPIDQSQQLAHRLDHLRLAAFALRSPKHVVQSSCEISGLKAELQTQHPRSSGRVKMRPFVSSAP
jgi:hypothetical protein